MTRHTHDEILAAIAEIARSELRLEGPLPTGDLSEQLDSVQRLTLVVALEDRFEVSFLEEDDSSVRTLDDVVRVILARLEEAGE
jgi:acyl carrier protein